MSIHLYFGLPRSGKTAYCTYLAICEQIKIFEGKSSYERVICNWPIDFPGILFSSYDYILNHACGRKSLIFIDEAQLDFSDRDFKSFSKKDTEFFTMASHYLYDLRLITQQWDGVDRKIRVLVNDVFYVKKGRWNYSHIYPVKYSIFIPRRKDNDSSSPNLGQIIQGYERWSVTESLFHRRFWRPYVYGLYDTHCDPSARRAVWLPEDYPLTPSRRLNSSFDGGQS